MSLDIVEMWHSRARPKPTDKDFNVQLGCHFEEVAEMVETLTFHVDGFSSTAGEMTALYAGLKLFAEKLKSGEVVATIADRKELLDSLADQVVTAVGVGYCAKMNVPEAVWRVNSSNWTKYDVDGKPIRDANGKIAKGPNYKEPDLSGLY